MSFNNIIYKINKNLTLIILFSSSLVYIKGYI